MIPSDFIDEIGRTAEEKSALLKEQNEARKQKVVTDYFVSRIDAVGDKVAGAIADKKLDVNIEINDTDVKDADTHALLQKLIDYVAKLPTSLPESKDPLDTVAVSNLIDYTTILQEVKQAVNDIEVRFDPKIEVKPADVKVEAIDLKPLLKKLDMLVDVTKKVSVVMPEADNTPMLEGLEDVKDAINALTFPVSNFLLPFLDSSGASTQLQLEGGALPVTSGGAASYQINDIEDDTTSYFGFTDSSASYMIKKVTDTSVSYATITNNGAVTTYSSAWTNRATLTYNRYDEAF
jgi:hypothetical protein